MGFYKTFVIPIDRDRPLSAHMLLPYDTDTFAGSDQAQDVLGTNVCVCRCGSDLQKKKKKITT